MPANKLPTIEFEWTPQLAYTVGLLATDGNLSKDGRHIVLRSTDFQLVETFKECLNISASIGCAPDLRNDGYQRKPMYTLQAGMVQLYRWLLTIGLTPNKTHTLGALTIPDRYFNDFLRGHLDGDGSVTTYKDYYNTRKNPKYIYDRLWLRFISVSEPHITWLRSRVFELTGSQGHLWKSPLLDQTRVPMWVLKFGKKDSIKLLNWMYYNPSVPCLERKRQKAEQFLVKV